MSAIPYVAANILGRTSRQESPLADIASSVVALGMGVILTLTIALFL